MAPKQKSEKAEKAPKVVAEKVEKAAVTEKVDDSKSEKPKKPEKKDYEDKINDITAQINKKKEDIAEIVKKIDDKNLQQATAKDGKTENTEDSKEGYENQRKALFNELSAIKEEKNQVLEQKKQLYSQEKQEKDKKRDMQKELHTMAKDKLLCSEEEIDNEINKLEMSISLGTLGSDIKAEKKVMQQISLLRKKKPEAIAHGKKMAKLEAETKATDSPSATTRKTSLESLSTQLDKLSEKQTEVSKKLDALKEEKNKRQELIRPLIEARSKLRQEVTDLMNAKTKVINERKDAFSKWKIHEAELQKARDKKWNEEQAAWEAEKEARNAEKELSAPCPHMDHVICLEQTIDYCKGLLPLQQQKAAKEVDVIHDLPKGTQVMKTKKERSEEMFCDASKGKRGKKGNKILSANNDEEHLASMMKKKQSQSIKHTAESLTVFKSLSLPTPMIVSDLPDTINRLQSKLDDASAKVKDWEAERKNKIAEALKAKAAAGETDDAKKE